MPLITSHTFYYYEKGNYLKKQSRPIKKIGLKQPDKPAPLTLSSQTNAKILADSVGNQTPQVKFPKA